MNTDRDIVIIIVRRAHLDLLNQTLGWICYVLFLIALILHGPGVLELLQFWP